MKKIFVTVILVALLFCGHAVAEHDQSWYDDFRANCTYDWTNEEIDWMDANLVMNIGRDWIITEIGDYWMNIDYEDGWYVCCAYTTGFDEPLTTVRCDDGNRAMDELEYFVLQVTKEALAE